MHLGTALARRDRWRDSFAATLPLRITRTVVQEGRRDPKLEQRFAAAFTRLRAKNVAAREPIVRKLDEKLWEVRIDFDRNAYPAVYVTVHERRFVILHSFIKKQQRTPRREIEAAQRLLERLIRQEERRTRER